MRDAIESFSEQFAFEPVLTNREWLKPFKRVVVAGMGGSNLAGPLLRVM